MPRHDSYKADFGTISERWQKNKLMSTMSCFYFSMYFIQHCFICRPTDSTVSEDAGIEPRTVATSALAVRRSSHAATSHPHLIHHVL
jgi:hypothetical protein